MSYPVHKVTAFITRDCNGNREILVFKHPTAGIQLPAGTVEVGEDIETAVIREAQEETGIQTFHLQSYLGGIENELNDGECIVTHSTRVRLEPHENATPYENAIDRGNTIQFHESAQGWSRVSSIEYDQWPDPKFVRWYIMGWVPNNAISHKKPRHFYHLTTPEQTPDRWAITGDAGHIFEPFWTPLSPKPDIVPPQNKWLDAVYDQLHRTP